MGFFQKIKELANLKNELEQKKKDIEEANLDMNLIRDIIFKETILKIQKKESNKIQKLD